MTKLKLLMTMMLAACACCVHSQDIKNVVIEKTDSGTFVRVQIIDRDEIKADTLSVPASLPATISGAAAVDTIETAPTAAAEPEPEFVFRRKQSRQNRPRYVVEGGDTIRVIPDRNLGRYDRGLYNYLFIPRGQWAIGITASYGEFNTDDVQLLDMLKNINFDGKIYSLSPTFSYFIRDNQSLGLKFTYTRAEASLGSLSLDYDDDLNFSIHDVSYYQQNYGVSLFYRNYIGLNNDKRFGIYNEVEAEVSSGSSRFNRIYNDEPRDTKTITTKAALNFSPGLTVFIMDYVAFNVSFGVFGLHITHQQQCTDGVEEGSRTTSGANFKFNIFNIKFGTSVYF